MTNTSPAVDQELGSTIKDAILTNDCNAATLLDILAADTDIAALARHTPHGGGGLSLHMYAAFIGAERTLSRFISSLNGNTPIETNVIEAGFNGRNITMALEDCQDIYLALLSNKPDTFIALRRAYESCDRHLPFNTATARSASTMCFGNANARLLTPLDVAMQFYVAQRVLEADAATANAYKLMMWPPTVSRNTAADVLEEKIYQLLQYGAVGARNAYFPTLKDSLRDPFYNADGFEVMSLTDFCNENASYIPADLQAALGRTCRQRGRKDSLTLRT
ncbi:MAG: hypothetical protein V4621_03405 [Pseudomonadota bacterium]